MIKLKYINCYDFKIKNIFRKIKEKVKLKIDFNEDKCKLKGLIIKKS